MILAATVQIQAHTNDQLLLPLPPNISVVHHVLLNTFIILQLLLAEQASTHLLSQQLHSQLSKVFPIDSHVR